MDYRSFGIEPELVKLAKKRAQLPSVKERLVTLWNGTTKQELQDPERVKELVALAAKAAGIKVTTQQSEAVVRFVLAQRIDPDNLLHLLRLWAMFR